MPDDAADLLRSAFEGAGIPTAVDKRVRNYRSSIAAMMGEERPRQLVDFDNHLLNTIQAIGPAQPEVLAERVDAAMRDWSETSRHDLYGLTPDTLRDSLIKLEDLSFRDGVRVAMEDPSVIRSMFVLLKSGNIDYRKGAIYTLEEVAKRNVAAIEPELLAEVLNGPYTKEERVMLIENSTEFGRIVGRMLLNEETRSEGHHVLTELAASGEDTQLRLALKTFTHLSKVAPEHVDPHLVPLGLRSGNDFNRETTARVVQNLCKKASNKVDNDLLLEMASDSTWAVRQVAANAIANLWSQEPARAEDVIHTLEERADPEAKKVAERARKAIAKRQR